MKNFYKKVLAFWGLSYCFLPNKVEDLSRNAHHYKEKTILATKNKTLVEEKRFNSEENKQLQEYLNDLNKTEIYLLITDLKKEKFNKPILLLLHTEDRLNSEQSVINDRHLKLLFSLGGNDPSQHKKGLFSINQIVQPNLFPDLAQKFRGGRSYYINNLGGYKSICPVFFDKASAEDFLIQSSKNALLLLKTLPLDSNREPLQGLINTKIISIGLGDFIEYFSIDGNNNYLEKVEFLFMPCLQKNHSLPKELEKRINNIVKHKTFKEYQRQYYNLMSAKESSTLNNS